MYRSNPDDDTDPGNSEFEKQGQGPVKNWGLYLKMADLDLMQFLSLYPKLCGKKDALAKVAHLMKNTQLDWVVVAQNPDGLSQENMQVLNQTVEELMKTVCQQEKIAYYTVHRNLGFVMMKGLLVCLTNMWEILVSELGGMLTAQSLWQHMQAIRRIEHNMMLAFSSQEAEEFAICVYHCKCALEGINELLGCIQNLPGGLVSKHITAFKKDASKIVFDLRELCLQTIDACKEEAQDEEDEDEDEV